MSVFEINLRTFLFCLTPPNPIALSFGFSKCSVHVFRWHYCITIGLSKCILFFRIDQKHLTLIHKYSDLSFFKLSITDQGVLIEVKLVKKLISFVKNVLNNHQPCFLRIKIMFRFSFKCHLTSFLLCLYYNSY